jgi:hypothetical protein
MSTEATANTAVSSSTESSQFESTGAPEGAVDGSQTQETAEAQVQTQAEAKAEAKRLNKLRLKVDGRELEEELPFEIDEDPEIVEYLTKNLQMSKAAQKRMAEYAEYQKQVNALVDKLRKNPRAVLSDPSIGIDLKQLAAEIIEEEIANSQKSPEQLEKEKLERELQALRDEREREKSDFQRKEFERLQEVEFERYDSLMTKALETSDLPKSPYVVKKMAEYMLLGLNEGIELTPEDVIPLVRDEIQSDISDMFAAMPEDVVEKLIGKDTLGRIRKKNLSKAKGAPPVPVKSAVKDSGTKAPKADQGPSKAKNFKDFFGF